MAQERLGSTPPPQRGMVGLLRDLLVALRPSRSPSRESFELLEEHGKALERMFPEGKPSGDGSEHYDRHVARWDAELDWQLTVRKWFQVAGLIGTFVSLAGAIALAWNYVVS